MLPGIKTFIWFCFPFGTNLMFKKLEVEILGKIGAKISCVPLRLHLQ